MSFLFDSQLFTTRWGAVKGFASAMLSVVVICPVWADDIPSSAQTTPIPVQPSSTQPTAAQPTASQSATSQSGSAPSPKAKVSKFYTVIDSSGKMRTVQRDTLESEDMPTEPLPTNGANPMTTVDGVQYVDSDYLEKRQFNLDGKKKFYAVPDGLGGTQIIERVPGAEGEQPITDTKVDTTVPSTMLVTLSPDYQRVPALEVSALIGMSCLPAKALSSATIMHDQQVILWPRSDAPSVNHRQGLNYVLVDMRANTKDLSLQSFAPLGLQSDYYWPLPIFLDDRGCVLEGVNGFYQKTLPSTMLQQSILVGTLHAPDHARYLMLTPLTEAIDLPNIHLSELGQVRLIPLR